MNKTLLALLALALLASPAASQSAITPVVSAGAEATHVLKATPGRLVAIYATNHTSTAGFLLVLNVVSVPADGAVLPLDCVPLPANGNASIFYGDRAKAFNTGLVAIMTSAATCFTKTTGTITGFFSGSVD